jgi:NADH dehydrogenase
VGKQLRRLGVDVLESVSVSQVRWDAVVLSDGAVPSAATVWTAGFGVPDLAVQRTSHRCLGGCSTDETTSIDDERVVGGSDAAAVRPPLRMSCQAAGPLGGRQHRAQPHRRKHAGGGEQAFVGQCISLGRSHATFSSLAPMTPR